MTVGCKALKNCQITFQANTIILMGQSCVTGAFAIFFALSCLGCGGAPRDANSAAAANAAVPGESGNSPKTNVEELSLLINMPYEVDDELVWKEDPAHKKLVAVMHFSKAGAEKVVADAAGKQAPQNTLVPSESWFPAELIAQAEMSGDDALNGTAYAADAFFLEPYTSGRMVRVQDTDYFILQLSAK